MTCRTQTLVWCDGCEELIFDQPSSTAEEQRKYAHDVLGWVVRKGGRDFCRDCRDIPGKESADQGV